MGEVVQGNGAYKGCVLKEKDDMDKIVNEVQSCDGLIIAVPSYDLTPSALYLRYAHRCLAYEVAFRLAVGELKRDPHLVAGLIAVGGSCHDWQSLSMEVLGASLFTQSIQCVDQLMATRTPACVRDVIPPWSIPVTHTGTVSSFPLSARSAAPAAIL